MPLATSLALGLGGCGTLIPRNGIADAKVQQKAVVSGLPGVRLWGDEIPGNLRAAVTQQMSPGVLPATVRDAATGRLRVDILALSGGGQDGVFGAGLLAGWSQRGDRPKFQVVTGVSAGALVAPFAFLGPSYDAQLKRIWTEYKTADVAVLQLLPGLLGGASLVDTSQLEALVAQYVDRRMMRAIAAEFKKGRLLLIGTTNLDAQRPVVWNIGAIAASGHPEALDLIRKVLLASAAVPGAFKPVSIEVEAGGNVYEELHVDGGTTRELFVAPFPVPYRAYDQFYPERPLRRIFVVKNGKLNPEPDVVPAQTIPIAGRAITTLTKYQSLGDIYKIYRLAGDDGADFNLIAEPPDFAAEANEALDPKYQTALFEAGYKLGLAGGPWMKKPPEIRAGR